MIGKRESEISHARQLQNAGSATGMFSTLMKKPEIPKQLHRLVGEWAIFESSLNAGTSSRPGGQAGYPTSLVASWDTVPVKCCVPLLLLLPLWNRG